MGHPTTTVSCVRCSGLIEYVIPQAEVDPEQMPPSWCHVTPPSDPHPAEPDRPVGDPVWVHRAVRALRTFGPASPDERTVAQLLDRWQHVDRLTPEQRHEVAWALARGGAR